VSDFYTPNYFDPVTASGVRYSYTGAITKPGQVLRGGYLSWKDATSGHWWQETWFDGGQPTVRDIGPANARAGSIRAFIDRMSGQYTINAIARGRVNAVRAGMTETQAQRSMGANATMWHEQINTILGRSQTVRGKVKRVRSRRSRKKSS
jgi:hypothetical protein